MNVLIVSQCSKRARVATCRIVDQFAERFGDGCWQTQITAEGLKTLKKLLSKTARKNTAVACHWLKKNGQTELLWIVGTPRRFNAQGRVPTNRTGRKIVHHLLENRFYFAEDVAVLAGIAGLFHDFGKANDLFQDSLKGEGKRYQPYRHEWVSLRLFQAFVGGDDDKTWLKKLHDLPKTIEQDMLKVLEDKLFKDKSSKDKGRDSDLAFQNLPPLAQIIAWLIVSHHHLPRDMTEFSTQKSGSEQWFLTQVNVNWNAQNHESDDWKDKDFETQWQFSKGLALRSHTWKRKAQEIAKRALASRTLFDLNMQNNSLHIHLARFCLMLADHSYSSGKAHEKWQGKYPLKANKEQKLDEHLVGVAHHAFLIGRSLSQMRDSLPAIVHHKGFRKRTSNPQYAWQNKAWDMAHALRHQTKSEGFFGINMASTGCGKTFANAKIMYALNDEGEGARFSIALGLRTLTLQTGDALRERLKLDDTDLAVLIGAQTFQKLWEENKKDENKENYEDDCDSSSKNALDDETQSYVSYEGSPQLGSLAQWIAHNSKTQKLIASPILVSTIDHLIGATEGVKGGRQLPAMLRLLSSDLVLDEIDDFDIADLHAVCRLVYWSGLLGSRVLLSSATLSPVLQRTLFEAYQAGWNQWRGKKGAIRVAWFDEQKCVSEQIASSDVFTEKCKEFINERVRFLDKKGSAQKGKILNLSEKVRKDSLYADLVKIVHEQIIDLASKHYTQHKSGKTVSLGLVRFANINPLVSFAKEIVQQESPDNTCLHYCVYHARHPLIVRSNMERRLDKIFTRHDEQKWWQHPDIQNALEDDTYQHHVFVVLATSVVEVGRDWDADWGIIEPSSMRSIIQFAGRIQRHRKQTVSDENIVILHKNIKALKGCNVAYTKPGFETEKHLVENKDLIHVIPEEDYQTITSIPRIKINKNNTFAKLEHIRYGAELLLGKDCWVASDFWQKNMTWNAFLQKKYPFRKSAPQKRVFLHMEDEDATPAFCFLDDSGNPKEAIFYEDKDVCACAKGVCLWGEYDYAQALKECAERFKLPIEEVGMRFAELIVYEYNADSWYYHPHFGVYQEE